MKNFVSIVLFCLVILVRTNCFADSYCEDWMTRGGYCVDYVKSKVPAFPVPLNHDAMVGLKNKETSKVAVGDVAIFDMGNYWHVAYVEKVHMDRHGHVKTVDVSEMNFGRQLRYNEYLNKWSVQDKKEWQRAISCGVTKNYAQVGARKNVALKTIKSIWSPAVAESEKNVAENQISSVLSMVKERVSYFYNFL